MSTGGAHRPLLCFSFFGKPRVSPTSSSTLGLVGGPRLPVVAGGKALTQGDWGRWRAINKPAAVPRRQVGRPRGQPAVGWTGTASHAFDDTFTARSLSVQRRAHVVITQLIGYDSVPTVLDVDGFQVRILLPPREHGPAHVHVRKAGTVVVIDLPEAGRPLSIRTIWRMRDADVVAAFRLVEANVEMLLEQWRKYHG